MLKNIKYYTRLTLIDMCFIIRIDPVIYTAFVSLANYMVGRVETNPASRVGYGVDDVVFSTLISFRGLLFNKTKFPALVQIYLR